MSFGMRTHFLSAGLGVLAFLLPSGAGRAFAQGAQGTAPGSAPEALERAFAEGGVVLDREAGACAVSARAVVLDELLEYVLVGPGGALHESLLRTDVRPSLLNAALLLLGVEPGRNAVWTPVEPPPTLEERRAGKRPFTIELPHGDGFFLYLAWAEGAERYLFRLEDVLTNLAAGRSMRRHRWVFLGSRFLDPSTLGGGSRPANASASDTADAAEREPVFAADREGNLISLVLFEQGHTLLTAALPECLEQSIWVANRWLLPPPGSELLLVFSRERLTALPATFQLPEVARASDRRADGPADGDGGAADAPGD